MNETLAQLQQKLRNEQPGSDAWWSLLTEIRVHEQERAKSKSDKELETMYLGDSVYISVHDGDNTCLQIFLNNGETTPTGNLLHKSEITLDREVVITLFSYLLAHLAPPTS